MGSYKEARIKDLGELIEEVRSGERKLYSSHGEERRIIIYDDFQSSRYDGSDPMSMRVQHNKMLISADKFMGDEDARQCAARIMEEAIATMRQAKIKAIHQISEGLIRMTTFESQQETV